MPPTGHFNDEFEGRFINPPRLDGLVPDQVVDLFGPRGREARSRDEGRRSGQATGEVEGQSSSPSWLRVFDKRMELGGLLVPFRHSFDDERRLHRNRPEVVRSESAEGLDLGTGRS